MKNTRCTIPLAVLVSVILSSPAWALGIPIDTERDDLGWEESRWSPRRDDHSDFGISMASSRFHPSDEYPRGDFPPGDHSDSDSDGDSDGPDSWDGNDGHGDGHGDGPGEGPGSGGVGHDDHGNGNGYGHCSHGNGKGLGHANDDCGAPVPEAPATVLIGMFLGALSLVRRRAS